jgi:hypothetical protein
MATAAVTPAPAGNQAVRALLSRVTRDQGPEFEQTLNWANTTQLSTPTSLRTDRKIKFIDLHIRGRITNALLPRPIGLVRRSWAALRCSH